MREGPYLILAVTLTQQPWTCPFEDLAEGTMGQMIQKNYLQLSTFLHRDEGKERQAAESQKHIGKEHDVSIP